MLILWKKKKPTSPHQQRYPLKKNADNTPISPQHMKPPLAWNSPPCFRESAAAPRRLREMRKNLVKSPNAISGKISRAAGRVAVNWKSSCLDTDRGDAIIIVCEIIDLMSQWRCACHRRSAAGQVASWCRPHHEYDPSPFPFRECSVQGKPICDRERVA